jgi:hypothetical protein
MSNGRRGGSEPALILGMILLVIGVLFLLRNTGALNVDWGVAWPILLIAVGLVVLAGALGGSRRRGTGVASVVIPSDGASRLELSLRLGAGRYRLAGGASQLVEVVATDPTIESRVERLGDVQRVRLSPSTAWWGWNWRTGIEWRIGVAPSTPTVLDLRAGAGDFSFDLSEIDVTSATVSIGAAELRLVLPKPRGEVPIRVEGGAASLSFQVPPGVEARVSSRGLVATSGRQETPGYASASDRVTVTVSGGAASVRVI